MSEWVAEWVFGNTRPDTTGHKWCKMVGHTRLSRVGKERHLRLH